MLNENYQAPMLDIVGVFVESGFALSSVGGGLENPDVKDDQDW